MSVPESRLRDADRPQAVVVKSTAVPLGRREKLLRPARMPAHAVRGVRLSSATNPEVG